jgi:hypothetical protein
MSKPPAGQGRVTGARTRGCCLDERSPAAGQDLLKQVAASCRSPRSSRAAARLLICGPRLVARWCSYNRCSPNRTTAAVIPPRRAALAALPILAVSGGQADTAYDAVDRGDQAGQVNSIVAHQPAAQPWVSPINGGRPQLRLTAESRMAARHHAHSPYKANRADLSMTPQEVKPVMRCHPVHGPSNRPRT